MIVGIDEVGRGAWAGPLVVGAVLLGGASIDGLTDSKLLSKKERERLDGEIRRLARGIGLGWVSAHQIDQIGLSEALKLASRRALAHIHHDYEEIIIDGTIQLIDDPRVTLMKKADLLIPSVSAASIVAKVARDNYMKHMDGVFPGFAFHGHVGYGTAAHRKAIDEIGVTPIHRFSFAPLKKYQVAPVAHPATIKTPLSPTTKQIGDTAEAVVASNLQELGHEVVARNWRTKYCEIDIVSKRAGVLYFTEVKYRKTTSHGDGKAAVTKKKQQQMAFAAELYCARYGIKNSELRLCVADVTGIPQVMNEFLELL
jgi:ribonuclease HII